MGSRRAAQRSTAGPRWRCSVTRAASEAAAGIPSVACWCAACRMPARTPRSHRNLPLRLSRLPQDGPLHPQHGRQRSVHLSIPTQRDLQVFKLRGSGAGGKGLVAGTGCGWAPGMDGHAVPCPWVHCPLVAVLNGMAQSLCAGCSSALPPENTRAYPYPRLRTCRIASDVRPS